MHFSDLELIDRQLRELVSLPVKQLEALQASQEIELILDEMEEQRNEQ